MTASQIRQDLNNFGGFGQQGYGYNVKYLYSEIARILGIDRQHNLIIIGAGNLGQAIANYTNFERRGFLIKGMFDVNPRLVGLVVRGVEIRGIEDLEQFIKDNDVQIAALTIPKSKAPEIADQPCEGPELRPSGICPHGSGGSRRRGGGERPSVREPDAAAYRVCSMQDQKEREKSQAKGKEAK